MQTASSHCHQHPSSPWLHLSGSYTGCESASVRLAGRLIVNWTFTACDWLLEVLPLVLVCLCYRLKEPLDLPWCLFSIKSPNSPFRPAAAKTTERPRSRQRSSWKTKSAKDVCKAAPVEFAATSGARDQNSHGSVGITLLSHGSDQFSDQQIRKRTKTGDTNRLLSEMCDCNVCCWCSTSLWTPCSSEAFRDQHMHNIYVDEYLY